MAYREPSAAGLAAGPGPRLAQPLPREYCAASFDTPNCGHLCGQAAAAAKVSAAGLVCFVLATSFIAAYRRIKWDNVRPDEVANEMRGASVIDWFTGGWGERMARPLLRFHIGHRSVGPRREPYSERNVLIRPFLRGFVPRFIYGDKGESDAGEKFGAGLWAYDDPLARDHGGAFIAPSMPGDLYDAGGVLYIVLGGLIWGIVLGLIDGWKSYLPLFNAAAIAALLSPTARCLSNVTSIIQWPGLFRFLSLFPCCRCHRFRTPPQS